MAKCPKCGSNKFRFELRSAGTNSNTKYYRTRGRRSTSYILPTGKRRYQSNRKNKSIGFCPECGYMQDDQSSGSGCAVFVLLFFIVSIIMGAVSSFNDTPKDEYIWAHEITPLDQFEYVIDGQEIHLKKYTGKEKRVYVGLEYNVDGEIMPVVEIGSLFSRTVHSVIIPDGTEEVESSLFNGSSVKYLYVPATLHNFKGWSYFHDLEYLYYGGSEEQMAEFYSGNPSNLVSKRIFYNSSIEDIIEQDILDHPTPEPTDPTDNNKGKS